MNESGGSEYPRLHIENSVRDTVRIDDGFAEQRHRGVSRWIDFTDHAPEIKFEVGFELAGKLLHTLVIGEAMHLQRFNAAVACAQKCPFEQHRADTVTLPGLLDAERSFALANEHRSETAQFGGAPQDAVDEKTVHDHAQSGRRTGMVGNKFVGHRARKTTVPAFRVKADQVIAISVSLADPQFADHSAIRQ